MSCYLLYGGGGEGGQCLKLEQQQKKQALSFHVLWETRPRIYISLLFFPSGGFQTLAQTKGREMALGSPFFLL